MKLRSLFDVCLPAFPALFTVFGVGLYWHQNILPTLGPSLAFWAVVVVFYLDARIQIPGSPAFSILIAATTGLWLVSSITGQNLRKYILLASQLNDYSVILKSQDLYYCYGTALLAVVLAAIVFWRLEPLAVQRVLIEPGTRRAARNMGEGLL